MPISYHSLQGSRDHQEDRLVAERLVLMNGQDSVIVMVVMDGHGGAEVAELLHKSFTTIMTRIGLDPAAEVQDWRTVLTATVVLLGEMTKDMQAGSTLSAVLLPSTERKAYVAVIGDSPVIIKDLHGTIHVSPEHNARSNPAEREAAIARGAKFDGTYLYSADNDHGLQMSRAFGDKQLSSFLSREPDVYEVELGEGSFVLVATDGLLSPGHLQTEELARQVAGQIDAGADAKTLVSQAAAQPHSDNVTAIVAKL